MQTDVTAAQSGTDEVQDANALSQAAPNEPQPCPYRIPGAKYDQSPERPLLSNKRISGMDASDIGFYFKVDIKKIFHEGLPKGEILFSLCLSVCLSLSLSSLLI